jgi:hypothetical protein
MIVMQPAVAPPPSSELAPDDPELAVLDDELPPEPEPEDVPEPLLPVGLPELEPLPPPEASSPLESSPPLDELPELVLLELDDPPPEPVPFPLPIGPLDPAELLPPQAATAAKGTSIQAKNDKLRVCIVRDLLLHRALWSPFFAALSRLSARLDFTQAPTLPPRCQPDPICTLWGPSHRSG